MMTQDQKSVAESLENMRPSTLPFDPGDLVAMRVRPAQFARMCGVSKQAVSQWISEGKVSIGPDGLLDPVVASRQVFERTDPARLRARVFRAAMAPYGELQAKVRALESELDHWRTWRHLYVHHDDIAERGTALLSAIEFEFDRLAEANRAGNLNSALERLWGRHMLLLTDSELDASDERNHS